MSNNKNPFDISSIQRFVFYVMLITLPFFFIPLPWDVTERSKGLLFLLFTTLIIFLEIIKWIWNGKITIVKSKLDIPVGLILVSGLISTILARDPWVAVWGMDGRLSNGLLIAVGLAIFFFLSRSFLYSKEGLLKSLEMFLIGISITTFLSLLSIFKVDILGGFGGYREIFTPGLPLTVSYSTLFVLATVAVLISSFLFFTYISEKKNSNIWYIAIMAILNGIVLIFASMGVSLALILLFIATILFLSGLLFFKVDKNNRYVPIAIAVFGVLVSLGMILLQSQSARDSLLGENFEILTPFVLGNDMSWNIATSAISSNLGSGIFGLGNDSFSEAYTYFKPATSDVISLGNTSFNSASNEIFTLLTNTGLFGVALWAFLGIALFKIMIQDIKEYKKNIGLEYLILDTTAVFLFLVSFLLPLSFLLKFSLYIISLFVVIVHNYMRRKKDDLFVIRFWAMDLESSNKNMTGVNWVFTSIIGLAFVFILIKLFSLTLSTSLLLKAEAYSVRENERFATVEEISMEDRETFMQNMLSNYDNALKYDKSNPVINRRLGLMSLEMLGLVSEQYQDEEISEEDKEALLKQIGTWKNITLDFTRESITTSPYIYANWNSRASAYLGLVGVGLQDYSEDALTALSKGLELNPLDYDAYYKMARVYVIGEDYEKALGALNAVLQINNQHISSLVLAAQIQQENGNTEAYTQYLTAAKEILEAYEQTESDTYQSIVKALEEVPTGDSAPDTTEVETNPSDQTEPTE